MEKWNVMNDDCFRGLVFLILDSLSLQASDWIRECAFS